MKVESLYHQFSTETLKQLNIDIYDAIKAVSEPENDYQKVLALVEKRDLEIVTILSSLRESEKPLFARLESDINAFFVDEIANLKQAVVEETKTFLLRRNAIKKYK
ncbi:hypothetical protein DRW07_16750 [Alteromonas sediminis]|uniref:Flagellar protein FliT n=1 Tax=Alteromonas sediminis TaxID=2259342 RepID=A0A3N5Z7V8_9ALTE|nr:hypothetical protein [Alteromonas sediminis]RPJ64968.1 hypothetical protein DRW07_16750 [Alteromonas sediminis]